VVAAGGAGGDASANDGAADGDDDGGGGDPLVALELQLSTVRQESAARAARIAHLEEVVQSECAERTFLLDELNRARHGASLPALTAEEVSACAAAYVGPAVGQQVAALLAGGAGGGAAAAAPAGARPPSQGTDRDSGGGQWGLAARPGSFSGRAGSDKGGVAAGRQAGARQAASGSTVLPPIHGASGGNAGASSSSGRGGHAMGTGGRRSGTGSR
jgi:hypothetical protein